MGLLAQPSNAVILTAQQILPFRNAGGFELLGRSADLSHLSEARNCEAISASCQAHNLDALVLVGGARTSTQASYLAEYFLSQRKKTLILTAPIDMAGSLKNEFVETSVGFDTASKGSSYSYILLNYLPFNSSPFLLRFECFCLFIYLFIPQSHRKSSETMRQTARRLRSTIILCD